MNKQQLRARSGCNPCRKRRKKCDEKKPACTRCRASSTECTWRTSQQLHDDRRRSAGPTSAYCQKPSSGQTKTITASEGPETAFRDVGIFGNVSPQFLCKVDAFSVEATIAPTISNWDNDNFLFSYYLNRVLPSTIHKSCRLTAPDFSYWSVMAASYPPLMDTALACAAMSIFHKTTSSTELAENLRKKALRHQTTAVRRIREYINTTSTTGCEDWLLAAIDNLVMFTCRDPGVVLACANPHIRALAEILKRRESAKYIKDAKIFVKQSDKSPSVALFERICYESFFYYSTIFMWFDHCFEALSEECWGIADRYFCGSCSPRVSADADWPILGVPHTLFKLIMDVSSLSRQDSLSKADLCSAAALREELATWRSSADSADERFVGTLYIHVAEVLLHHVLRNEPYEASPRKTLDSKIQQCIDVLALTEIGPHFSSYLLWPLNVLADVATEHDARQFVLMKLAAVYLNRDGAHAIHLDSGLNAQQEIML